MNVKFSEHEEGFSKGKTVLVMISSRKKKLITMMRTEEGEDRHH